jgi:uncharacterized radical SAM protein YgiQ
MKGRRSGPDFLPVSLEDMSLRGWDELDFLCVTGDAYVDHPSFGISIVSRVLESMGFRVGIVAQPNWRGTGDFTVMGRPRLGVLVTAGNLDSMLSNYSSPGKRRARDDYAPGGEPGLRPDRATIVYCNRIREIWGGIPLIIGGIEASLRRMAHYDYWSDAVRGSIQADSRADLLIYGMAEYQLELTARRLAEGVPIGEIRDVPGTCWKTHDKGGIENPRGSVEIPSFGAVSKDKSVFADAFGIFYGEQNFASGRAIAQDQGSWTVVQNPPPPPLTTEAMDKIYSLPYARAPHPMYGDKKIPAFAEVSFSVTSHRGCFGECAFCAITVHQGRVIQARSAENIVREVEIMTRDPGFKGYVHDVGGPTANFRTPPCRKSVRLGACKGKSCVYPALCRELRVSHREYLGLLRKVRAVKGVKKVFVRSGLRIDYIMADPRGRRFLEELCANHVSGQLKIAPEHADPEVLRRMRKFSPEITRKFIKMFREINRAIGKNQFLVPYFMSSHPGCGMKEAMNLADFMREERLRPEQVQEFAPTPGTPAACMYHTGVDPFTGERVYVARTREERSAQRALLRLPRGHAAVRPRFGGPRKGS